MQSAAQRAQRRVIRDEVRTLSTPTGPHEYLVCHCCKQFAKQRKTSFLLLRRLRDARVMLCSVVLRLAARCGP